jgi:phosphate-selective porin OprO/OprP
MTMRRFRDTGVTAGLLGLLLAGAAGPALAQTTTDERIAALEAKIAELSGQIADLKASTSTAINDVRTQAQATAPALANGRPTIATADGQQKFAVRALVQFDGAAYEERGGTTDLNSGFNFRRARLGVEGTFARDWNYALTGEFGGSGSEAPILNQAYVEYAGFKPFGLVNPLRIRLGAYATPTGLEDATSNTENLFLERPAVAEMVRNFAGGDGRNSFGVFANGDHWYASAALTGDLAGNTGSFDEQYGYLTRIAFNPLYSPDYSVHIGANLQGILQPADTAAGAATLTQVQLRERPELRVDGTRLVDTGLINADGLTAYGGELGAQWKNFYVAGEAFKINVDRLGAYDPSFSGWYVHGAWTITKEAHVWNAANGGYRGIRPAKNFDPANHTWGAWEIAARYSVLDLNDNAGVLGSATPAGGIRGGEQKITTLGLNWYPHSVFRFLLDYQWINVDRLNSAGAQIGQDANVVSLRTQFSY